MLFATKVHCDKNVNINCGFFKGIQLFSLLIIKCNHFHRWGDGITVVILFYH